MGQTTTDSLITPDLLRRLEQLELVSRRRARSQGKGERLSRARGQSVEFADFRNYTHGDDLRYLDWNLYGRLDRLFVKLYEEERELPVTLFLDASESMNFGEPEKFGLARRIAAAIGYVAVCGFDRVSVVPFPEHEEERMARMGLRRIRGRAAAFRFFDQLGRLSAYGRADLNGVLRREALQSRRAGRAVVLSDFLDPAGYEAGLRALVGRGFEVYAVQILSPQEWAPDHFGDLRLIDAETGTSQEVTFGRHRLKAYQEAVERYVMQLRGFCQRKGIAFSSVRSDHPLDDLLLKGLKVGGMWR